MFVYLTLLQCLVKSGASALFGCVSDWSFVEKQTILHMERSTSGDLSHTQTLSLSACRYIHTWTIIYKPTVPKQHQSCMHLTFCHCYAYKASTIHCYQCNHKCIVVGTTRFWLSTRGWLYMPCVHRHKHCQVTLASANPRRKRECLVVCLQHYTCVRGIHVTRHQLAVMDAWRSC